MLPSFSSKRLGLFPAIVLVPTGSSIQSFWRLFIPQAVLQKLRVGSGNYNASDNEVSRRPQHRSETSETSKRVDLAKLSHAHTHIQPRGSMVTGTSGVSSPGLLVASIRCRNCSLHLLRPPLMSNSHFVATTATTINSLLSLSTLLTPVGAAP